MSTAYARLLDPFSNILETTGFSTPCMYSADCNGVLSSLQALCKAFTAVPHVCMEWDNLGKQKGYGRPTSTTPSLQRMPTTVGKASHIQHKPPLLLIWMILAIILYPPLQDSSPNLEMSSTLRCRGARRLAMPNTLPSWNSNHLRCVLPCTFQETFCCCEHREASQRSSAAISAYVQQPSGSISSIGT